jgi:toxin YoeB
MRIEWAEEAWEDYLYWQQTNKVALKRINALIKDIARDPFDGIGKPEPLKHHLSGFWSRRIDDEHRLIYAVDDGCLKIAQCRYHY